MEKMAIVVILKVKYVCVCVRELFLGCLNWHTISTSRETEYAKEEIKFYVFLNSVRLAERRFLLQNKSGLN